MPHPINPDLTVGDVVKLAGAVPFDDGGLYSIESVTPSVIEKQFAVGPYATGATPTDLTLPEVEPKVDFIAGKGGEVAQVRFAVKPVDGVFGFRGATGIAGPLRLVSLSVGVNRAGETVLFLDPQRDGGDALFPLRVDTSPPEKPNPSLVDYFVQGDDSAVLKAKNLEPFTIGATGVDSAGVALTAAPQQTVLLLINLYSVKSLTQPSAAFSVFQRLPTIQT